MSTQEFTSTNPTIESIFLDGLISPNVVDSVLTRNADFIDQNDLFSVEFEARTSLNSLATEYIGKSFLWEIIADVNNLNPQDPTEIGKILKVPTEQALAESIRKYVINSPEGKILISSVKDSILNLTNIGNTQTEFSKTLKECVNKVISFKFDNTVAK